MTTLVAPSAIACAVLAASPALARGQAVPGPAIWFTDRYDPVTDGYRPVVLQPLPAGATRAVQAALASRGHDPGPVTGVLDSRTRATLRDFQVDRGLRITGIPDYDTVVALGLPVRRVPPSAAATLVRPRVPRRAPAIIVIGPAVDLPPIGVPIGGVGVTPAPTPLLPPEPPVSPPPGVEPAPNPSPGPSPPVVEPPPPAPDPPPPAPRRPRGMTRPPTRS